MPQNSQRHGWRESDGRRDLNAKEAALLYMAADEAGAIVDDIATLPASRVHEIIGDAWRDKLGAMREKADIPPSVEHDYPIAMKADLLLELAQSPAGANEVSRLVSRRFGGAAKALNFMTIRPQYPDQDQRVMCSEEFVAGMLGPLWDERLRKVGIETERGESQGHPQVYLPIAGIMAHAGGALNLAAAQEASQPTRRKYGSGGGGSGSDRR